MKQTAQAVSMFQMPGAIQLHNPSSVVILGPFPLTIPNTKYGFTLLEVLIATVIMTLGVLAITRAFSLGLFATTDVENVDLALNIARAKVENVFSLLKDENLATLNISNFESTHSGTDPNFSNFSVTVDLTDQNPPSQDLMKVDVIVAWTVKESQASTSLATLVAD